MGRSKKNYDHLVDFFGNYLSVNSITGVTRLINGSPNDLRLNPPTGLGDVTIDIHPNTTLLRTGDDISRLNNDVGYIKGLDYLDEIGDVNVPAPDRDEVLTWDGNEWVAKPTKVPDAFLFRGRINVDVDHPEPDPQYGWTYVQSAAGTNALTSWVGIAGDAVQEKDLVIYAVTDEWQVISNPFQGPNITDLQVVINPEDESYRGGHLQYNPDTGAFFFTPAYTQEFADLDNPLFQPDTYDERYVRRAGDLMSGDLSFTDNLKIRFLGEGDINAVTELRLGAGIAGTGLKLTDTTIESERLNVQFWVGNGAPEPGNPGNMLPTLSSRLDSSYGPLFSYYGQVAEDYNIVNKIYVDDLFDETLEKCLRIDGSNGMKGDINMNGSNPTIKFNNDNANLRFSQNLSISPTTVPGFTQIWTQFGTYFQKRAVSFYANDSRTVLKVSLDHATAEDGHATYVGQILSGTHLVNKQYVDQADGQVAVEIVELEARVKDNEDRLNGILDEVAAEGYIKGVTVKETITGAPGTDAEVVDDHGELTFTIPQGIKGERGQPGFNGTKGNNGVKGDGGVKGDKGQKGQKGQIGPRGTNGTDGVNPQLAAGTATKLGSAAAPTVTATTSGDTTTFDFGIPAGQKGQKGAGQKGQKGAPGEGGSGGGATVVYRNGAYYVSA
jgi:hypothetical protein